jgi:GlpG protein
LEEEDGRWAIWVHAEDQLDQATRLLEEFRRTPEDRKYAKASRTAREKRDQAAREAEAARKRYFDRTNLFPRGIAALGKVTLTLIALSLLFTLVTGFGGNTLFSWFTIVPIEYHGDRVGYEGGWGGLVNWQVWRWLTPMFVHMGFIHLLFNMWWTKDLGSALERYLGRWKFLGLVLLISAPANAAQFLSHGPLFGGMSGVVYGLLAYIWVRSKLDPFCGLQLHPTMVTIMAIWFVLCLTGVMGPIANVVHAVGLGVGALAGAVAARRF